MRLTGRYPIIITSYSLLFRHMTAKTYIEYAGPHQGDPAYTSAFAHSFKQGDGKWTWAKAFARRP